jgi:hypothetical protein
LRLAEQLRLLKATVPSLVGLLSRLRQPSGEMGAQIITEALSQIEGAGEQLTVLDYLARLDVTLRIIREHLPPEQWQQIGRR